jgi:hypothetical protein
LTVVPIGASVSPMSSKKMKAGRATKDVARVARVARVEATRRTRRREFVDIPIEGPGERLVGWLRVEAHRIMWGDKETKKWRRVPLDNFIEWINNPKASRSELVEN